jgi:hypothetical protein
MDFIHSESTAPVMTNRLVRIVLAAIALGAVIFGGASMLARPTRAAPSAPVTTLLMETQASRLTEHLANAGEDTGPGCAESEVAKLPDSRH